MHPTDDAHARGAAMVARAARGDREHRCHTRSEEVEMRRARSLAVFANPDHLASIRALSQSDAALARAFDEA